MTVRPIDVRLMDSGFIHFYKRGQKLKQVLRFSQLYRTKANIPSSVLVMPAPILVHRMHYLFCCIVHNHFLPFRLAFYWICLPFYLNLSKFQKIPNFFGMHYCRSPLAWPRSTFWSDVFVYLPPIVLVFLIELKRLNAIWRRLNWSKLIIPAYRIKITGSKV